MGNLEKKITEGLLVLKEKHLVLFSLSILLLPSLCISVLFSFLRRTLDLELSSDGLQCFQWQKWTLHT